MEVHCYPVLTILISIPLPTLHRKTSPQNQVHYLLLTSYIPAWQSPSLATCSTSETPFQLSLTLLSLRGCRASGELSVLVAQKSIWTSCCLCRTFSAMLCASLSSSCVTGTGSTRGPATIIQPEAKLRPLRKTFSFPIPK